MSFIKVRILKDGAPISDDVRKLNVIGPATAIDNDNGDIELDTNVAMGEIEDINLTGLSDNDNLQYNSSTGKWDRKASVPPAPPGTSAIVQFIDDTVPALSGNTTIPFDSSLPQIGEGSEIWSQTFTPVVATSKIRVSNSFTLSSSAQNMELVFALFRDTVCLGTVVGATIEKDSGLSIAFTFIFPAQNINTVDYSLRVGKVQGSPGSWFINQISGLTNGFSGTLDETGFSITELAVLGS